VHRVQYVAIYDTTTTALVVWNWISARRIGSVARQQLASFATSTKRRPIRPQWTGGQLAQSHPVANKPALSAPRSGATNSCWISWATPRRSGAGPRPRVTMTLWSRFALFVYYDHCTVYTEQSRLYDIRNFIKSLGVCLKIVYRVPATGS